MSYCLKCWKSYRKPKSCKDKKGSTMILSECVVRDSKLRFIKEQEASLLLGNNSPFRGIPLIGNIL